jgi:hypothetical protein
LDPPAHPLMQHPLLALDDDRGEQDHVERQQAGEHPRERLEDVVQRKIRRHG